MTDVPLRICHVSPHLPPDQAANALLPATLGERGAAQGHAVSFVAHEPAQGQSAEGTTLAGPVEWVPRRAAESAASRFLRRGALRTARSVSAALEGVAGDASLVHLHSNGLIVEVAAAWARRKGIPTLLTLYGTEIWHYRPRRPVDPFRRAYEQAAEVTFYSQGLLDHARGLGLVRPGMSVVYPAVSDAFQPQDEETRRRWRDSLGIAEPQVIVNVKRLHELAGHDTLLDAFAQLARTRGGVRLVICGTGPLREALERQARQLDIADRVTFTGLVSNAEVSKIAALADVFALPSRLEALPTVAVEALAAGTPVVSADHPGGVELNALLGDDVRVVPRNQPPALAAALTDALEHPRRTTMATRQKVRAQFSPDAVYAAYRAAYARITGADA